MQAKAERVGQRGNAPAIVLDLKRQFDRALEEEKDLVIEVDHRPSSQVDPRDSLQGRRNDVDLDKLPGFTLQREEYKQAFDQPPRLSELQGTHLVALADKTINLSLKPFKKKKHKAVLYELAYESAIRKQQQAQNYAAANVVSRLLMRNPSPLTSLERKAL